MAYQKQRKMRFRILLDVAMTLLMVTVLACRITGILFHEWAGVVLFILFLIHHILNRRWFTQLLRGAYSIQRTLNTCVDLFLIVLMSVMFVTGMMQSSAVLSFLHLPGGMILRQIHATAAYWGFVFIALHLGLHWNGIWNATLKKHRNNWRVTLLLRVAAFLIVLSGIWASFERSMGSKLFKGFSFDFWAPGQPVIFFFLQNVVILAMYATLAYYILKLITIAAKKKTRTNGETIK